MAMALAVKILIIVGFVALPAEVAISLGAVHGVALAVAAGGAAAALLIRRRRADTRHGHGHGGLGHDHNRGGHIGFVSADAFAGEPTAALGRIGGGPVHRDRARPGGSPESMRAEDWNDSYAGTPHWDLGRPQPAMQALAERGEIRGRVLDVGCGTGEHVLMCAALGLDSTGIDVAPAAVHAAKQKARHRGLSARFVLGDAHHLAELGDTYDTVLDVGLFHIFGDEDRASYVRSLRDVVAPGGRYLMLCFSDQEPGNGGPRRVSAEDIATTFADGWRIAAMEPTMLMNPAGPAGIHGWRLIAVRS
jgi:SAM-dependent methyltransferase